MNNLKIAFQGELGAYSELAAIKYFRVEITPLPCYTFEDIFVAVASGDATHGLLPIENSLAGSIHRNYDMLLQNELEIVGEYYLRVSHCLMALPGVELSQVRRVLSHPQALAQCAKRLRQMQLVPIMEADTAGS
ncbi:MAG: prephenate dehydratase domain-containing protein, partial [Chloroflexota bacterium]|nr:prephenate dehydratase domain-containing protein [Chloroflexota bacterium]